MYSLFASLSFCTHFHPCKMILVCFLDMVSAAHTHTVYSIVFNAPNSPPFTLIRINDETVIQAQKTTKEDDENRGPFNWLTYKINMNDKIDTFICMNFNLIPFERKMNKNAAEKTPPNVYTCKLIRVKKIPFCYLYLYGFNNKKRMRAYEWERRKESIKFIQFKIIYSICDNDIVKMQTHSTTIKPTKKY